MQFWEFHKHFYPNCIISFRNISSNRNIQKHNLKMFTRKNEKFTLSKRIFREINSLVKPLVSRNFWSTYAYVTNWKLRNFTATVFSSNQRFTKELYCKLIWRKKFCVAVNFSFFHTELIIIIMVYVFSRKNMTWSWSYLIS